MFILSLSKCISSTLTGSSVLCKDKTKYPLLFFRLKNLVHPTLLWSHSLAWWYSFSSIISAPSQVSHCGQTETLLVNPYYQDVTTILPSVLVLKQYWSHTASLQSVIILSLPWRKPAWQIVHCPVPVQIFRHPAFNFSKFCAIFLFGLYLQYLQ